MNRPILTPTLTVLLAVLLSACGRPEESAGDAGTQQVWTCSMHPQIQQPALGDCPICGMDLIPLEDTGGQSNARAVSLSEAAAQMARFETTAVERMFPEKTVRLYGKVDYDETRIKTVSARFPARVERLFADFEGMRVRAGDHLAEVYSPELLTAQRELITARGREPDGPFAQAAYEKLALWGLSDAEINRVIEQGEPSDRLQIDSPAGGIVVEKAIKEGDYVETGDRILRIASLDPLWVLLDAYETDLPWLRYGQTVGITAEGAPGRRYEGTIAFIRPEVDSTTRTVRVRVNVANPDGSLKPGMFVSATAKATLAAGGRVISPALEGAYICPMHPEEVKPEADTCGICGMDLVPVEEMGYTFAEAGEAPLVVPASAVLRTGKRAVVYVRAADTDEPTYEGREIVLGPRAGNVYLVESGLEEGEQVVTQGAFKIDSALQIQARPSMMSMAPGDGDMGEPAPRNTITTTPDAREAVDAFLGFYFGIQSALADDDLAAAKNPATGLLDALPLAETSGLSPAARSEWSTLTARMKPELKTIITAAELSDARGKVFERLSLAMQELLETFGSAGAHDVYLMHCPMVYGDTGADWLQDHDALLNPYWGSQMLHCGVSKGRIVEMKNGAEEAPAHEHHGH